MGAAAMVQRTPLDGQDDRWQYCVLSLGQDGYSAHSAELNRHGALGWEVYTVLHTGEGRQRYLAYFMKRKLKDGAAP